MMSRSPVVKFEIENPEYVVQAVKILMQESKRKLFLDQIGINVIGQVESFYS